MELHGVSAVVTGGASGLGEATARALAERGAKVAVLDIQADQAQAVASEIGGVAGACDVTDAASAEAALEAAKAAHGPVGVAVNCAGVAPAKKIVGRDGPMPLEDFRRVIEINLIGSFNVMRLAAAQMVEREPNEDGERGVIISTASVAAYEGQIGQAAYAASKGGIVGLTLPAARELASSGVRVLSIAPGLFGTPMMLGMPRTVQDSLAATLPFPQRFGKPAEYADLVLFMIGNPLMNGETVRIDNALRMAPR
ncbi:MAG: SDR family NAD(P)-dependent oxidoreductase [Alphaproteobacteria bacterium]|nr:SDR family NAD(P)-dependent oxidoreductase [Alphaproteobacteria bacterium]